MVQLQCTAAQAGLSADLCQHGIGLLRLRDGPGRPAVFSDTGIQFCLSIKVLFKPPLRLTAGMLASRLRLAGLVGPVPECPTL